MRKRRNITRDWRKDAAMTMVEDDVLATPRPNRAMRRAWGLPSLPKPKPQSLITSPVRGGWWRT